MQDSNKTIALDEPPKPNSPKKLMKETIVLGKPHFAKNLKVSVSFSSFSKYLLFLSRQMGYIISHL